MENNPVFFIKNWLSCHEYELGTRSPKFPLCESICNGIFNLYLFYNCISLSILDKPFGYWPETPSSYLVGAPSETWWQLFGCPKPGSPPTCCALSSHYARVHHKDLCPSKKNLLCILQNKWSINIFLPILLK